MRSKKKPNDLNRGEVLVAVMNNKADFAILQEQLWYRIPVASAPKRWPPKYLALYQTKIFENEGYAVNYYGAVRDVQVVERKELFPNEIESAKAERKYYRVRLESLEKLATPIQSKRPRRLVFIPTTWQKLIRANGINDLFDESPLEDALWAGLKTLSIPAERQWDELIGEKRYFLDFAIFCEKGKIDVETDGDLWHSQKERIPLDNTRNNALASKGWEVLRYNTKQIREESAKYCVSEIAKTITRLNGLQDENVISRVFYKTREGDINQQLTLFEEREDYDVD